MEVPEEIRRLALAARAVSVLPPPAPRPFVASKDVATHRRNPANDVRMFPAVPQSALRATPLMAPSAPARAWWEDPVALGSLLILAPPIGLAALWSSHRYSSDARWALTIMTALTMCLSTAIAIAALVKR
jgi:hypothetical protein